MLQVKRTCTPIYGRSWEYCGNLMSEKNMETRWNTLKLQNPRCKMQSQRTSAKVCKGDVLPYLKKDLISFFIWPSICSTDFHKMGWHRFLRGLCDISGVFSMNSVHPRTQCNLPDPQNEVPRIATFGWPTECKELGCKDHMVWHMERSCSIYLFQ